MKRFYINVQGGTGLNIALASFISKVKEENPAQEVKEEPKAE